MGVSGWFQSQNRSRVKLEPQHLRNHHLALSSQVPSCSILPAVKLELRLKLKSLPSSRLRTSLRRTLAWETTRSPGAGRFTASVVTGFATTDGRSVVARCRWPGAAALELHTTAPHKAASSKPGSKSSLIQKNLVLTTSLSSIFV